MDYAWGRCRAGRYHCHHVPLLSMPWEELLQQVLTSQMQTALEEAEMPTPIHCPWNLTNTLLTKINSIVMHSGSSHRGHSRAHCFHTLIACDLVFSVIFVFAAAIGFLVFPSAHLKHLPLLCFSCLMASYWRDSCRLALCLFVCLLSLSAAGHNDISLWVTKSFALDMTLV